MMIFNDTDQINWKFMRLRLQGKNGLFMVSIIIGYFFICFCIYSYFHNLMYIKEENPSF